MSAEKTNSLRAITPDQYLKNTEYEAMKEYLKAAKQPTLYDLIVDNYRLKQINGQYENTIKEFYSMSVTEVAAFNNNVRDYIAQIENKNE